MSFIGLGPNELLLSVHGLFFILIVGFGSYTFGAIYFINVENAAYTFRLKVSALLTFLMTLGLMVSGILPDVNFGDATLLTASYNNAYGNYTQTVGAVSAGNFTGPLLFDMMEHISFVGLALAAVIVYLIWRYEGLVFTDKRVKWSILSLIMVTVAWPSFWGW